MFSTPYTDLHITHTYIAQYIKYIVSIYQGVYYPVGRCRLFILLCSKATHHISYIILYTICDRKSVKNIKEAPTESPNFWPNQSLSEYDDAPLMKKNFSIFCKIIFSKRYKYALTRDS